MPIHPTLASRLPLLEGISSFREFSENPDLAARRRAYTDHPEYEAPAVATRTEQVPGPHGPVPVRIYAADPVGHAPCLVWMHGGAFLAGDLDTPEADWVARELVARAGIVVVSVDYRLCTSGITYPVPLDDVVAAARWVRENASSLDVDSTRISIGGASAGGNLAAGATLRLRDEDDWAPAHLVLAYAVAHTVIPPASASLAALMQDMPPPLRFPPDEWQFLARNYLGGPISTADGYAFPALATLEGLCPVLALNAEYDDLRPSSEAFAGALALAGVNVRQVLVKTMLHGFLGRPANLEPVGAAIDLIAVTVATVTERTRA